MIPVDILHTEEISEDENALPSPEDLSGYILVKVILLYVDFPDKFLVVLTDTVVMFPYVFLARCLQCF